MSTATVASFWSSANTIGRHRLSSVEVVEVAFASSCVASHARWIIEHYLQYFVVLLGAIKIRACAINTLKGSSEALTIRRFFLYNIDIEKAQDNLLVGASYFEGVICLLDDLIRRRSARSGIRSARTQRQGPDRIPASVISISSSPVIKATFRGVVIANVFPCH